MLLDDEALEEFWIALEQQAPGVLRILQVLAEQEGMTAEQYEHCRRGVVALGRALSTISPAAVRAALADDNTVTDMLLVIAGLPVKRALRLLAWTLEQAEGQGIRALQQLGEIDPDAARIIIYHWQQVCRWTTVWRMFAPQRIDDVQAAIHRARAELGLPEG
jgi:hypothetical protein